MIPKTAPTCEARGTTARSIPSEITLPAALFCKRGMFLRLLGFDLVVPAHVALKLCNGVGAVGAGDGEDIVTWRGVDDTLALVRNFLMG